MSLPSADGAEHIMVMPALDPKEHRRWTAREVRELIAANPLVTPRYELVDGELLVTPSPNVMHQRAVLRLAVLLDAYLEANTVGVVLTSPSDVELEPDIITQPDLYVVPTEEWRRLRTSSLPVREVLLAVEVLSPSSVRHDRVTKRERYQRRVPDYWIVDLDARVIEVWRPGDTRPDRPTVACTW